MDKSDYKIVSKLEDIKLEKLHIQYLPMAKLERYYRQEGKYNLMSLVNSPHVEIMEIFDKHGLDIHTLMNSRYAKERLGRRKLGMREWNKPYLLKHFKTRYKAFKDLKEFGFNQDKCWDAKKKRDRSILVCRKPFWCSRFDVEIDGVTGWEIQNGAGRASAMYVLGFKTIPGFFIEDLKPGTKKWKRITKRFRENKNKAI